MYVSMLEQYFSVKLSHKHVKRFDEGEAAGLILSSRGINTQKNIFGFVSLLDKGG